ncbi:hypothetical protein ABZ897_55345 [Nonomuraea sp. NPDC046802]|uniref:hypothetical protein n=1 Tax=Nonomuraea sp. NPDC046802 TaxID=3154919 RepID=UPI0033C9B6DE
MSSIVETTGVFCAASAAADGHAEAEDREHDAVNGAPGEVVRERLLCQNQRWELEFHVAIEGKVPCGHASFAVSQPSAPCSSLRPLLGHHLTRPSTLPRATPRPTLPTAIIAVDDAQRRRQLDVFGPVSLDHQPMIDDVFPMDGQALLEGMEETQQQRSL